MEEIINEMDDFDGKELYEYKLVFRSIDKSQRAYLINHFCDYAWEPGLAIAQCHVSAMPKAGLSKLFSKNLADVEFIFKSPKQFQNKDDDEWTEEDLETILDTRLVGKEQFFSNIWYSDQNMNDVDVRFYDQANNEYRVELGKYSDIIKVD